jgi:hypothetical protein
MQLWGFLVGSAGPDPGSVVSKHVLPFVLWYGATNPAYFRDVSGIVMVSTDERSSATSINVTKAHC